MDFSKKALLEMYQPFLRELLTALLRKTRSTSVSFRTSFFRARSSLRRGLNRVIRS